MASAEEPVPLTRSAGTPSPRYGHPCFEVRFPLSRGSGSHFPEGWVPCFLGAGTLFPSDGLPLSRHGYHFIRGTEISIFQGRPPLPREGNAIPDGRAPVVRATSTLFRMTGALISEGRAPCSEDVRRFFS